MRNERMAKEAASRPQQAKPRGREVEVFKTAEQRNYEAKYVHREVTDKELFASIPKGSGFFVTTVQAKGKAKANV